MTHCLISQRLLAVFLLLTAVGRSQPGTITTIAGGYTGDGGRALLAGLNSPMGIALGSDGTLYVADSNSHRVRRVSPDGMISTFAGNGTNGYSGDGGPATEAQLNFPQGLALGPDGSLYIADTSNRLIRRVDPDGNISTFAGSRTEFGLDGGPAKNARFRTPAGLAIDSSGRLYIVDSDDHRIRMVNEMGNISTVAGTGVAAFSGDGGPAADARLSFPQSIALVGDGSFYIADRGNIRIRFVDVTGKISTFTGDGASNFSGYSSPSHMRGIAIGKRGVYVADSQVIVLVSWDGKRSRLFGSGGIGNDIEGGPASRDVFAGAETLIVTDDETLYFPTPAIAGSGRSSTTRYTLLLAPASTWATRGGPPEMATTPREQSSPNQPHYSSEVTERSTSLTLPMNGFAKSLWMGRFRPLRARASLDLGPPEMADPRRRQPCIARTG